jgi:hypothetical protein
MSSKALTIAVTLSLFLILAGAGVFLWNCYGDRPSHQEGFRQMMDKKAHGRDLFDGFTTDPSPRRKEK